MALADDLAAVLRHPAILRINFSLNGARYDPGKFRLIAQMLTTGAIGAAYQQPGAWARYQFDQNTLYWPISGAQAALCVHESAHAIQDCFRYDGIRLVVEAAAYIAQVVFMACEAHPSAVAATYEIQRIRGSLRGSRNPVDAVGIAAINVVMAHPGMLSGAYANLSLADVAPLMNAISRVPNYRGGGRQWLAFDGIAACPRCH